MVLPKGNRLHPYHEQPCAKDHRLDQQLPASSAGLAHEQRLILCISCKRRLISPLFHVQRKNYFHQIQVLLLTFAYVNATVKLGNHESGSPGFIFYHQEGAVWRNISKRRAWTTPSVLSWTTAKACATAALEPSQTLNPLVSWN